MRTRGAMLSSTHCEVRTIHWFFSASAPRAARPLVAVLSMERPEQGHTANTKSTAPRVAATSCATRSGGSWSR